MVVLRNVTRISSHEKLQENLNYSTLGTALV